MYNQISKASPNKLLQLAQEVHKYELNNKIARNNRLFYSTPTNAQVQPNKLENTRKLLYKWWGLNKKATVIQNAARKRLMKKRKANKKTTTLSPKGFANLKPNEVSLVFKKLPNWRNHASLQQTSKACRNIGNINENNKYSKIAGKLILMLRELVDYITYMKIMKHSYTERTLYVYNHKQIESIADFITKIYNKIQRIVVQIEGFKTTHPDIWNKFTKVLHASASQRTIRFSINKFEKEINKQKKLNFFKIYHNRGAMTPGNKTHNNYFDNIYGEVREKVIKSLIKKNNFTNSAISKEVENTFDRFYYRVESNLKIIGTNFYEARIYVGGYTIVHTNLNIEQYIQKHNPFLTYIKEHILGVRIKDNLNCWSKKEHFCKLFTRIINTIEREFNVDVCFVLDRFISDSDIMHIVNALKDPYMIDPLTLTREALNMGHTLQYVSVTR